MKNYIPHKTRSLAYKGGHEEKFLHLLKPGSKPLPTIKKKLEYKGTMISNKWVESPLPTLRK